MNLLLRADAAVRIGTGHTMRCLALAQAWQKAGGHAVVATVEAPVGLRDRLTAEGLGFACLSVEPGSSEDARETVAFARRTRADQIVLDGYRFSGQYQRLIKTAGLWLLAVDDYGHAEHYWADAVLNQNLHAQESLYRNREPGVRLLLGTRYSLLRREFWKWRDWKREIAPVANKVLVTLGGSDADNVTHQVVAALGQLRSRPLEVVVVMGAVNPHERVLRSAVSAASVPMQLLMNVADMAELMAWADIAVSGGGSTSWELAFMGLPALTLVLAENQVGLAAGLDRHGVTRNLGWHTDVPEAMLADAVEELLRSHSARQAMSAQGRQLVDGGGGQRVIRAMTEERT